MIFPKDTHPFFFPVFNNSTPKWKWPTVLISFDYLPSTGMPNLPTHFTKSILMVESGGVSVARPKNQYECLVRQFKVKPQLILTLDYPCKVMRKRRSVCRNCGMDFPSYRKVCPKCHKWGMIQGKDAVEDLPEKVKVKRVKLTIDNEKRVMELKLYFQKTYTKNV